MPKHNLKEFSDNHSKISGSLWQYCRNKPDDNITDSKSFIFRLRYKNNTGNNCTVDLKVAVN